MSIVIEFDNISRAALGACHAHYDARLVSFAIFGSVGRGTPRPDSDLDLLIVADRLPVGRVARADDFRTVDRALEGVLQRARAGGVTTALSPVWKTPQELQHGGLLLLDMIDDARVLFDRDHVLRSRLERLRARLKELGAQRIWRGNDWFWDLKPDYRPGEIFEI